MKWVRHTGGWSPVSLEALGRLCTGLGGLASSLAFLYLHFFHPFKPGFRVEGVGLFSGGFGFRRPFFQEDVRIGLGF